MTEKEDIKQYSLKELRKRHSRGETHTSPAAPKRAVDKDFWKHAHVVLPGARPKVHTGIRIDADVLDWFKSQGKGWQTNINAILRSYYESEHEHHPR